MMNLKHSSILAILSISILLSACGEKSQEHAQNTPAVPAPSINQTETAEKSGPATVIAFISGNESSKTSFIQGAELAVSSNHTQTFELKFVEASEGNPASLNSILKKDKAPAVIYWSVEDIIEVHRRIQVARKYNSI